jgi:hypothetical protein
MLERSVDEAMASLLAGEDDASTPSSSNVLAETASTKADFPLALEFIVPRCLLA